MGNRRIALITAVALGAAVTFTGLGANLGAQAQDKTFVMKLSTATVNDTQHEWLKRYAAMVEKDSGGRIKGEVYAASQLGTIPRQIEGVQIGAIQVWNGPPEFLVGVDERYEVLSAPGLLVNRKQELETLQDPKLLDLILGLGANKGLMGIGLIPIGPSSIVSRKPVRKFADFKGMKIRVLASPFQLELIKRMDASPTPMTLGDVVPGLQQGTIDGSLSTVTVYTTMNFQDVAKYITETGQPYLTTVNVMSKKWFDTLPPDLQKIVKDDALKLSKDMFPYVDDFFEKQRQIWKDKGGEIISLPADEQAAMIAKISSVADDVSKSKPALNEAVKLVFGVANSHK